MLTVIVETGGSADRLPALLGALTSAAVEGLVSDVLIVGGPAPLLDLLREETGAELAPSIAAAAEAARYDRMLLLPAAIRLRPGWLTDLGAHLREGGGEAIIPGLAGVFQQRPFGVLTVRARALAHPDFKRLRRQLGGRTLRLG
jgi:hypothetical protein